MDPLWKALREKWDYGIDLNTAIDKEISEYVEAKAIIYKGEKLCDIALWEVYKVDFRYFTSSIFNRINPLAN
jgi:hypothetical protein